MALAVKGSDIGMAGVEELTEIYELTNAAGYEDWVGATSPQIGRILISPGTVRGLEYYTGPVYECELLFPVTNDKGETVQFGSVAGGGRYDGLIERFTGQKVPATGFSIGVSRLATALKNLGKLDADAVLAPVVVCIMDRDAESLGRYQEMVQLLRKNKIRAELFQGNPKNFGNQLKYADRRGSPLAIIQGADERAKGEVQIKDLALGARLARTIDSREAWTEARAAQFSVAEADLVAAVRKALAES
jgi:histidyl-tRNA synthetase